MIAEVAREAEAIGMSHLVRQARDDRMAVPVTDVPDDAEPGVFRFDGQVWELGYEGRTVHVPDAKGLRDLYHLVSRPGQEVPVAGAPVAGYPAAGGPDPGWSDRAGAAGAIPFDLIDATALVGPVDRIAERLGAYADAGVTTLGVMVSAAATDLDGRLAILHAVAEARKTLGVERSGVR